jgi:hypothetical protein
VSGPNIVSAKRRAAAQKHAARVYTCICGKVCHGNGGISSHKKACPIRGTKATGSTS